MVSGKAHKTSALKDFIRRNFFLKSLIKLAYRFFMFPFTRRGVLINIGGAARCRLDYIFYLRGYDSFGDKHNAGFGKWIDCCRDKEVVFDIGAHIGLYTIPASRVIRPRGKVYAFEPSDANKGYLMRHLKYNSIDNVVVVQCLIGDESRKEQVFYENKMTDPMNSIHPKKNAYLYEKVIKEQVSLDDFVRLNKVEPQVMKIDVEGAEYAVLKGAQDTLRKYSPILFLSVHPRQLGLFKSSCIETLNFINSLQYVVYNCDDKKASELEFGEYILCKDRLS